MSELDLLADRFEQDRPHLRLVAQRILGSAHEADDAVQEAWVRLSRSDTADVDNLTGWLTTVVSRVCLDMLRSKASRREEPAELPEDAVLEGADPAEAVVTADALGPALMLVLDALNPAERLAFVLHDLFAVPFPEIATIVGCTPAAARQLASRARRRVQGAEAGDDAGNAARKERIVAAFLAAAQGGDFAGLLEMLDPEVILRADPAAVAMGANALINGAAAVAGRFQGAKAAVMAFVDGEPAIMWALRGVPKVVFLLSIEDDKVTAVEQIADPDVLASMTIERA